MGKIIATRRYEDSKNFVVEVLLNKDEIKQLRGEVDNIHMFSQNVANVPARVSLRGKNEATKYFLIPKQLRKQLAINGRVLCQRIEAEGKSIFIYVLDPSSVKRESFIAEA